MSIFPCTPRFLSAFRKFGFIQITAHSRMSVDNTSVASDEKCSFCRIIKENDETNKILFQDDMVVVFTDIKPAAKHHYLIVTRNHIPDAKQLGKGDKDLVEHMVAVGKKMLEGENYDETNTRFGFHWPPFHSVAHLHLHVINPTQEMGLMSRMIFRPESWWFVSPEYVMSRMQQTSE